jgi:hypothetical protein
MNSPYAGDFVMVQQGKLTAAILASQVRVYLHHDYNHVYLWNLTHSEDTLMLGLVDALARNKTWPDYVINRGRVYQRDLQEAHPPGASASDWFGFRIYKFTEKIDTGKTHTMMILPPEALAIRESRAQYLKSKRVNTL